MSERNWSARCVRTPDAWQSLWHWQDGLFLGGDEMHSEKNRKKHSFFFQASFVHHKQVKMKSSPICCMLPFPLSFFKAKHLYQCCWQHHGFWLTDAFSQPVHPLPDPFLKGVFLCGCIICKISVRLQGQSQNGISLATHMALTSKTFSILHLLIIPSQEAVN